jgi:septum formation protein
MSHKGLFRTNVRLILASASPRRKEMLAKLGLDFEVRSAEVDEVPLYGESPEEFVQRAAAEKASEVSRSQPDAWVLGADTIVVHEGAILGKPVDASDALKLLMRLSGQMHTVLTGFCLKREQENISVSRFFATEVYFSAFSEAIAAAYVATGEPLDKAGAYGIQGYGGALVKKINGSYSNVVGLPLAETIEELLQYGVIEVRR